MSNKNYVTAVSSDIANNISSAKIYNPQLATSGWVNTNLGQGSYSGFNEISNSFIIADIPTIFTIISAEICGPKLIRIKYTMADPQLNTLSKSGNIYISSGIFGIYNSEDNFYWRNEVIIEVESEEYVDKIQPGMKFTNATQWEKKLTVEEIINIVNNPFEYYKYVHKIVEQYINDKPQNICIAKHQEIDKLYGLE